MTHVFVVNEITFNIHLQYLFAGIGYSNHEPNLTSNFQNKYNKENTLTGMIADISKVRVGDKIIFYVTGCQKFFGVFKIASAPFFESKTSNYLGTNLNKYLPFRIKIEPYKVFAKGISEQTALDDISMLSTPYEMCWSMIYRKLTGMRGCSFLMDFEMSKIENLLASTNGNHFLHGDNFCYNPLTSSIAVSASHFSYQGSTTQSLSINNRLHIVKGAHEGHVQAYITQNYDKDPQLISKLLPANIVINKWIGNEVICSVGERRMDVLIIAETDTEIQIRIIELKDEKPLANLIINQIPWYIKWVDQYIIPNLLVIGKPIKIIPTVFAYPYKTNTQNKQLFDAAVINFNNSTANMCVNSTVNNIDCIYYDRTQNPIKIY